VRLKAALLGRSRGGQTSKIHVAGDRKCRPVAFILTVGQAADSPQFIPVLGKAERGPSLVWCIGRKLLHRGLTAMSGCGDVRMWPALPRERPSSWLLLESQEVEAVFEVPAAPLAQWLDATYLITPAETEMDELNWDGFLRELLDDPATPSA
jgi:hypothetical protein